MNAMGKVLAITLMLFTWTSIASAQEADTQSADPSDQPSETTETFGNWTVRCRSDGQIQACEVLHVVRGQAGIMAQLAIGVPPEQDETLLVVQTPLGVLVSVPVRLKSSPDEADGAELVVPYQTCLQTGCLAQLSVDESELAALSTGETARLSFTERTGQAIEINIPLAGLRSALSRL